MLVAYLDESEDRRRQRYYFGALVLDGESATRTVEAMEAIACDAADKFPVPPEIELHGYELMNGAAAWECLAGKVRARLGIFKESLQAVTSQRGEFLVREVDVQAVEEIPDAVEATPHEICLVHVLQALDRIAEERGEYILVIADEHHLAGNLREQLRQWRAEGTPGHYKRTYLSRIVDTIHFTPSKESRLLQAADLLLYFHQRFEGRTLGRDQRELKFLERMKEEVSRIEHLDSGGWPQICTKPPAERHGGQGGSEA